MTEIEELKHALDESVKLQSHYARLLNQYDGGSRKQFSDGSAWLARLREVKKGKGERLTTHGDNRR